jgi:hypothetical protein
MDVPQPPVELSNLEAEANVLLQLIAAGQRKIDAATLSELDCIAGNAAKIAYGQGYPGCLTQQMRSLISWADHLDDPSCVELFCVALRSSPLRLPPWST